MLKSSFPPSSYILSLEGAGGGQKQQTVALPVHPVNCGCQGVIRMGMGSLVVKQVEKHYVIQYRTWQRPHKTWTRRWLSILPLRQAHLCTPPEVAQAMVFMPGWCLPSFLPMLIELRGACWECAFPHWGLWKDKDLWMGVCELVVF